MSLWYLLSGHRHMPIALDRSEFAGGRWWSAQQIASASPALFDPHLGRFIAKVRPACLRPLP